MRLMIYPLKIEKKKLDPVDWPTLINIHTTISLFEIGKVKTSRQTLLVPFTEQVNRALYGHVHRLVVSSKQPG